MHIDDIPKKMKAVAVEHSIFTGVKYCLCYSDGNHSTPGDPFGYTPKYDWKNALSVLWNKEELDAFRPNDTVHNFIQKLKADMLVEIERLKKLVPRASKNYVSSSTPKETPVNLKQRYLDQIEFLKNNTIVFLEITFGNEGENSMEYYS